MSKSHETLLGEVSWIEFKGAKTANANNPHYSADHNVFRASQWAK